MAAWLGRWAGSPGRWRGGSVSTTMRKVLLALRGTLGLGSRAGTHLHVGPVEALKSLDSEGMCYY